MVFVTRGQDVIVHLHVVPEEVAVPAHVGKEAAHQSRQVDDVSWLVLGEYGLGLSLAETYFVR